MDSGKLIKLLRTAKLINQEKISQKLDISQQAYSKIERRDYINKPTLQKILIALESSPEELEAMRKFLPHPPHKSE